MRRNRVLTSVASFGLLTVFLTASFAMARDKGDRKDGSNRGGHSSSHSGNSGNSGSSSSRSMSSSNSSGYSRSSFGSDSSRSSSPRSSQSIQIPSSDRSTRSFGSGNSGSTFSGKSFSGSSTRSSAGNSPTIRSFGSQSVARPIDGAITNRNTGNVGPSFQGFSGVNKSGGNSTNAGNPSPRNFNSGSNNFSPYNRFSNTTAQTDRSSDNNSRSSSKSGNPNTGGNAGNGDPNVVKRSFNGQNSQSGNVQLPGNAFGNAKVDNRFGRSQQNQLPSQTSTLGSGSKPSKDKVEDFLQLRRDNATNPLSGAGGNRDGGGQFNRNGGGQFNRNGNFTNDGPTSFKPGQLGSQKSLTDSKKDADQAWTKRFGKSDGSPGNNLQGAGDGKSWDGKSDRRSGIVNLKGDNPGGADRKFDKTFVDRNYQDWRKTASDNKHGGKQGGVADHRDWTGQWKKGDRFVAADQIRDHWKRNGRGNGKDLPFSKDWWSGNNHRNRHGHHGHHWNRWDRFGDRHYHPYHWWSWCSAPRLTTWVSFGWPSSYYWDYGPGEYIYCNNGIVYVNGTWFEPAPIFYRRTLLLAQQAPAWTPVQAAQIDWLPLGVFVVARDGVPDNNVLVQLAVTNDGVIGGTIFNQLTGASFPIQGMVDKETQRAAWTYTDDLGAQIVMESSIFNLTQPAATGLIHYGADNIQVIELVRLEDPNAGISLVK